MNRYLTGLGAAAFVAIAKTAYAACVWGFEPQCDDSGSWSWFMRTVGAIFEVVFG